MPSEVIHALRHVLSQLRWRSVAQAPRASSIARVRDRACAERPLLKYAAIGPAAACPPQDEQETA
eukprot:7630510-Pyramimonas_sp.AAC.1